MALPVEVIRLHLQQRHLSVTGNKREAAGRLFEALQRRSDDDSHGQETDEAEKGGSRTDGRDTDSPSTRESEAESDSRHSRARSKKNRPRKRHNHLREMESLLKRALKDGSRRRRRRRLSSSEPSSSSADSSDSDSSLERVRRPKRRWGHRTTPTPSLPLQTRSELRLSVVSSLTCLPCYQAIYCMLKREPHDHARSSRSYKQAVEITDFTAWLEAWSSYASVVASYFPTAAPRMFQCQQFLAGKSRKFKLNAWLQYDRVSSEAIPQQEPAL